MRTICIYIIRIHLCMLAVLSAIRIATLGILHADMDTTGIGIKEYAESLFIGLRLDNVVMTYVSLLPCLLLLVIWYRHSAQKASLRFLRVYYGIIGTVLPLHAIANIPFSTEYMHPIDISSLKWLDNGSEVFTMLLTDWSFLVYGIMMLAMIPLCMGIVLHGGKVRIAENTPIHSQPNKKRLITAFLTLTVLFLLGARGFKVTGHALNSSNAYFTSNHYINLCTQSPALYFVNSVSRYQRLNAVSFYSAQELQKNMQEFYGTTDMNEPWKHEITAPDSALFAGKKPNIVLIFMESMSSHYLQAFGQQEPLTPFLNQLYDKSLHFSRCYSAGFRTGQGLLGVLCSWPSFMNRNITSEHRLSVFGGLPIELSDIGYSTTCFISHDPNYDGLYDFFTSNGIRRIYSMNDYPEEEYVGMWGVPDGYLFNAAIQAIRNKELGYQADSQKDVPFFISILTITHHPPYDLPADFSRIYDEDDYDSVRYADECLRQFFEKASHEPWYDNTVFVLVGDHGVNMEKQQECELPDMINHVPLLIYGKDIQAGEYDGMASQTDIAATVLSMLGHSYTTNSLSVDLLNHQRPYVIYSNGSWVACRDREHLFLLNYIDNIRRYYRVLPDGNVESVAPDAHLLEMERYCLTTYQLELEQLKSR